MADALVVRTGLTIEFGKGEPSYIPSADKVVMPARESFDDESHLYTTLMHECSHSTLSKSRLNRSEALGPTSTSNHMQAICKAGSKHFATTSKKSFVRAKTHKRFATTSSRTKPNIVSQ